METVFYGEFYVCEIILDLIDSQACFLIGGMVYSVFRKIASTQTQIHFESFRFTLRTALVSD